MKKLVTVEQVDNEGLDGLLGERVSLGEKLASDMTIREKFAAMAMQALIPTYVEQVKELENAASAAVEYADALLMELSKSAKD